MTKQKTESNFYYAGGERVDLTPDSELVAVDLDWCTENLTDPRTLDVIRDKGQAVGRGIMLLHRDQLTDAMLGQLTMPGCTQPVFRREGTTMIALPEIRVEGNSTITLAEVAKFAGESSQPIKEDQSTGRLSIVPLSHDGRDSLNMANEIAEQFESISVSPRFLRITPGPAIREQI